MEQNFPDCTLEYACCLIPEVICENVLSASITREAYRVAHPKSICATPSRSGKDMLACVTLTSPNELQLGRLIETPEAC
jgi:hypothetical protein